LRKPPTGEDSGGRCANAPPGWAGCVMLRSMGRAVGEVVVDGGAAAFLGVMPSRARILAAVKDRIKPC